MKLTQVLFTGSMLVSVVATPAFAMTPGAAKHANTMMKRHEKVVMMKQMDTCTKTAWDAEAATDKTAMTAYKTAMTAARTAYQASLTAAKAMTDKVAMKAVVKTAKTTYRAAMKQAMSDRKAAMKTGHDTYKTAEAACKTSTTTVTQ